MADEALNYYANKLAQLSQQIEPNDTLNKPGYQEYLAGLDVELGYRGHPDVLDEAITHFVACEVRPYTFAGFALIMRDASYLSGGEYIPEGIEHGLQYWKRARLIQENRFEIDMVGTHLYAALKEVDKVRKILDKYKQKYNKNFWYCICESNYWSKLEPDTAIAWLKRAYQAAGTDTRKLYALNRMAGIELDKPDFGDAIRLYRKVVELDPQDPWAWHNLSWVYIEKGDLDNAEECNERALAIMDFGMARLIQRDIRKERNAANQKPPSVWEQLKNRFL